VKAALWTFGLEQTANAEFTNSGLVALPGVRLCLLPLTREGSDDMLDRIDAHFARHGWGFWALEERD
jgi:hypothetical protein